MKALILLITALFISNLANATDNKKDGELVPAVLAQQEIQFSYFNFNSYYSCSYVESVTQNVLADLGAQNIEVDCLGGLPDTYGNTVTATFNAHRETSGEKSTHTATVTTVGLRVDESCDLQETVIREVSRGFDSYKSSKSGSCWDSSGHLNYKLQVLR